MPLKNLPSIILETTFNKEGLVVAEEGVLVPAYVASQLGFNVPGRDYLEQFYARLRTEAGIFPLCPFKAYGEYLDFSVLDSLLGLIPHSSAVF
jgi:hypothetical protein